MPVSAEASRTVLPRPLQPLVGRSQEISELRERIVSRHCHLLTIYGPGGMGKTRLALELARRLRDEGTDVAYVDLQPLASAEMLPGAIASALQLAPGSEEDSRRHLLRYLQGAELLLVLDNFENCIEGAELLSAILQKASGVQLLVTSSVVLNLHEECLYPVNGLPYPGDEQMEIEQLAAYDAVQLFVACARRVRPDFELAAAAPAVARLCRFVEGMPLAIELAAAWSKSLSPAAIVAEVERDVSFLTSPLRNTPEKHRSLQVVFQRSWQQLQPEEQEAFRRLSVFRGPFTREAAAHVAAAHLPLLARLVDRSLIRWCTGGRYQIHELLRQFGAERLARDPQAEACTYDSCSEYYAGFLHQRFEAITGGQQRQAVEEVDADLDNIRVAWEWAAAQEQVVALRKMGHVLGLAFQFRSRYREGYELFHEVIPLLRARPADRERDVALITLLINVGWYLLHLGQPDASWTVWEECRELYTSLDLPPLPGMATDPDLAFSQLAWLGGKQALAFDHARKAAETADSQPHPLNGAAARLFLSRFNLQQGQLDLASAHGQEGVRLCRQQGERWLLARLLNTLGGIALTQGQYGLARGHYRESYAIAEEFADYGIMATVMNNLGEVARRQGTLDEAQACYHRSLELAGQSNSRYYSFMARSGLGDVLVERDQLAAAAGSYRQALHETEEMGLLPSLLACLPGISDLYWRIGRQEQAQRLLALVYHHSSSNHSLRQRVQARLATYDLSEAALPSSAAESAYLQQLVSDLKAELLALTYQDETASPPSAVALPAAPDQLVEPLSDREREVLRLIAAGLKNREIAAELFIAHSTVKSHIKNIYGKMAVSNRVEAVLRAQELGLL